VGGEVLMDYQRGTDDQVEGTDDSFQGESRRQSIFPNNNFFPTSTSSYYWDVCYSGRETNVLVIRCFLLRRMRRKDGEEV